MLFVLVNLARFVKVDPEQALRKTNAKFRRRFGYVEQKLAERGKVDARKLHSKRWKRCGRRPRSERRSADRCGDTSRALTDAAGVRRRRRSCRRRSGASTISNCCPCACLSSPPKWAARLSAPSTATAWSVSAWPFRASRRAAGSYLHSHMLGVHAGISRLAASGRLLKLQQREDALARGIDLVEWTFDPLEIKNAYFNMERLGAIVRRYVRNQYGTTTSQLHGGLPTDRCVAEWWIASPRVKAIVDGGEPVARPEIVERIAVPADIATIRREDPKRARKIQQEISNGFEEYFGRGLAVVGVERIAEAGVYLFGKWE